MEEVLDDLPVAKSEKGPCQPEKHWNCFKIKGNMGWGGTPERQDGVQLKGNIGETPETERQDGVQLKGNIGETPERQHGACLLYTSPSPRDRHASRMPSSA